MATVASSEDKLPSMDWRLAKGASTCAATSAQGIAAALGLGPPATTLLPASSGVPCAKAPNCPPPPSSTAALITTQYLTWHRPFFIADNLSSVRCITKFQQLRAYSDRTRPARNPRM